MARRNSSSSASSRAISPVAEGRILEGCLAINKPKGISSAQVLREMQRFFDPSKTFAPWLARESANRNREGQRQHERRRRSKKEIKVKIGHGGTLDPLATGVLITGIGNGTKELQTFLGCTKTYECVALFGAATDTYDIVGKVVGRRGYSHLTREKVEEALAQFRGKITQRPPVYSALHMQGKRLYEYAREGLELPGEIASRPVEVDSLEMVEWMQSGSHTYEWPEAEATTEEKAVAAKILHLDATPEVPDESLLRKENISDAKRKRLESPSTGTSQGPVVKRANLGDNETAPLDELDAKAEQTTSGASMDKHIDTERLGPPAVKLRMTVSSGFYVRSLCQDLGVAVGSLATMSELVRTRQADFELGKNVLEYDDLTKGEDVWGSKVANMLDEWNNR